VGAFNTLFGYSLFAVFNYLLHRRGLPVSYIFASLLSSLISITVAFLGYKFFVFRTRGNYLAEWVKALAVYWSGILPTIVLLPALVRLLQWVLPNHLAAFGYAMDRKEAAPYIANAAMMSVGVIYTFIGHKNITFRQR